MTIIEMIAVLQAAKEGKVIQFKSKNYSEAEWGIFRIPQRLSWNFEDFDYRVAPEPREFWVPEFSIKNALSREGCAATWPGSAPVLFREVL